MARRTALTLPSTSSITNYYSSGGVSSPNLHLLTTVPSVASGAGTADTLATVLSVTGAGYCPFLICYSNSAVPAHTVRCQVIVDSVTVFDATSDTITTTLGRGVVVVNAMTSGVSNTVPSGVPIRFNYSLEVKVASSQSGTDLVAVRYDISKTAS